MKLSLSLAAAFVLGCFSAQAQHSIYKYYDSVKVYNENNREQTLAWCGGLNNPQFTMGDLNNDGLQDLVVYEAYRWVKTFINYGTPGNPDYRYRPEYAVNFPAVYQYLVFTDYNCDNVPDMVQEGPSNKGFQVYTGYYNQDNQLCFRAKQILYYTNDSAQHGAALNAFNNPGGDIPAIVDVDNDGDPDFISYDIAGGNLNFYKNMRVELGLSCDSLVVELKDRCWGKVYQGFNRAHVLGYNCNNSSLGRPAPQAKKTHVGNTPCLFDFDGDGDYDYLDGSISFNEMTFLLNGRAQNGGVDSMIYQDTFWQSNGHIVELPLWPAAFNIDIDQDGKKDLVISPTAVGTSENYKCVWFYKNNSTPGHPAFDYQTNTYFISDMIDAGSAAYPFLFDYDKDGKPDLFVGSDGYYQSDGTFKSKISYYRNTSTTGNPSLKLQTSDFLGLSGTNYAGAALAMGDLNNDGLTDMVIGHSDGSLSFYKNTAASENVTPVWVLTTNVMTDGSGNTITVDDHAAPFIYDVDKDGKPDLVIGGLNGKLQYYRNTSTSTGSLHLTLGSISLGNAVVDPRRTLSGYSTPYIGKIDNTGTDYMVVGSGSGNLYRFTGFQGGNTTSNYTMVDSQFAYIDSQYLAYNHTAVSAAYNGLRSAPTFGDIDGDGRMEMIVGGVDGGLKLYEQTGQTEVSTLSHTLGNVSLYPNPAKDNITISWSQLLPKTIVSIINIQGQILSSREVPSDESAINIVVGGMLPGIYICVIQAGEARAYGRFTILK